MSDNNWKHRSTNMTCAKCMWFAEKVADVNKNGTFVETKDDREFPHTEIKAVISTTSFGRCRRRAPTMNGFPAVFGSDWCGDNKLDENKL